MAQITTRTTGGINASAKGSPLSIAELDQNFIAMNNDVYVDNYPPLSPSLNLDFVNSSTIDPVITFTRNSIASHFDSTGVLRTVSNNIPRLDYDPVNRTPRGLLIEESRTNFFTNTSVASGGTIGTGNVIGPDGVLCRTFIPTSGPVSFPNITGPTQTYSLSTGQTADWALSGWFAAGPVGSTILEPRLVFSLSVNNTSSFTYAELQINTTDWTVRQKALGSGLTEVSAPTITLFRTGLYRVTWVVRYTQDATARNNISAGIQARNTSGIGTYTADGISGFQYALVQAEAGSFVTSTIPTTTAAVTRNADVAGITNLIPWYNQTTGTVYAEFAPAFQGSATAAGNNPGVWGVTQNSLGFFNGYGVRLTPFSNFGDNINGMSRYAPSGFITQVSIGLTTFLNLGQVYKTAFTWEASGIAASRDGQSELSQPNTAAAAMGTHDQFYLGRQNIGGIPTQLNGYLRRVIYYPHRLTNIQLQTITGS